MLLAATDPELFDRTQWFAATTARREQLARAVAERAGADFEYEGLHSYAGTDLEVAVLRHRPTDLRFSLVPGGRFEMGMSPEEEQAIVDARPDDEDDEDDFNQEFDLLLSEMGTMRPLHTVTVPPFLIAQRVLTVGQVRRFIDDFVDPLYGRSEDAPAHLSNEQGSLVLIGTDLRLPSEAELEYAARGHLTRTLLPTSTRIPDEDTLEAMLADRSDITSNAFGLHGYGLYPERCADAWHEHYKGAPTDGSPWLGPGPRTVRGGAANCYPWQGCGEWNVMLCAFRMSDHAAEFGSALRLARGLTPQPDAEPTARPTPKRAAETPPSAPSPTKQPAKPASPTPPAETTPEPASRKVAQQSQETLKHATRTTAKPSSKKVAEQAARTTPKKASRRVAKPAPKQTAKKTAKTAAKTTAKKSTASAQKTAKKTTKTAAAKKTAKTAAKTTAKKSTASPKKTTKTAAAKKTAKTAAAKKSTAAKTTAKKSTASKTTAKKSTAAKTTAKKSTASAKKTAKKSTASAKKSTAPA
jgi:formylglycine-generating enzyme required for sulfatase activity